MFSLEDLFWQSDGVDDRQVDPAPLWRGVYDFETNYDFEIPVELQRGKERIGVERQRDRDEDP